MARTHRKFVNPRFIKTVDLGLMKRLLARHADELTGFNPDVLDQDEAEARTALHDFFASPEESDPEGLRSDLHRIAELGNSRGLEMIQAEAQRRGVALFPEMQTADDGEPNSVTTRSTSPCGSSWSTTAYSRPRPTTWR